MYVCKKNRSCIITYTKYTYALHRKPFISKCIHMYINVMYACKQRWMLFVLAMLTFRHFDFLVRLVRTKFNPTFCYWNIPSYVKETNNSGIIPSFDPSTIPISFWKESWAWWHHRCAISPWDPMKSSRVSGGVLWWFFMIFPRAWTRITWCLIYVLNRLESVGFFLCWICWVQTCRIRPLLTPSWGHWSFRPSFTVSHFELKNSRQAERRKHKIYQSPLGSNMLQSPSQKPMVLIHPIHHFEKNDFNWKQQSLGWVHQVSGRTTTSSIQFYPSRHNFPFRNCCQIRVSGKKYCASAVIGSSLSGHPLAPRKANKSHWRSWLFQPTPKLTFPTK